VTYVSFYVSISGTYVAVSSHFWKVQIPSDETSNISTVEILATAYLKQTFNMQHGLANCGTRTTAGTPIIVY
jgi:hypothetical protein